LKQNTLILTERVTRKSKKTTKEVRRANIYDLLLLVDFLFNKHHYLLFKRSTSLLVERDFRESLKNTEDKVRRETLFMDYYLG